MQFCQPFSCRDLQVDMQNFDGRKQRHFPWWLWCSCVLGGTNTQQVFYNNCLGVSIYYARILWPIFHPPSPSPPPPPPCTHMYTFRVTPFCVRDFIDLILSSPILTLLVCHNFLILFYLKNFFFVSDTHHFLASHSVNSSLPRKIFSLMVASNCQLFYLSWTLTKLSYRNAKESYSRRTTTVIVTVLTKVLSFS